MKPTPDDDTPRRDGWFEHKGTWAEVVLGTVIASSKRSERWEIIDVSHGPGQIDFHRTLWMRAREMTSGVEFTIEPRQKTAGVTILTQNPADTKTGDPTWPSDSDALALLIEELGATVLASRDNVTGEIHCPDYTYKSHLTREGTRWPAIRLGLIEHMRFAHAMPVDDTLELEEAITLHGKAHAAEHPDIGKGGFPHRHVPEDLLPFGKQ